MPIADTSIYKATLPPPWPPYAIVTYMECITGDHIIPQGWDNWKNPENEKTPAMQNTKMKVWVLIFPQE